MKVLGDHVHQAGSLVEPDRLRFDFTHFEGITPQQLNEVEDLVNGAILDGLTITTEELPLDEAKARGAVATFGEKYGQTVRVVTMGDFSMELCGGTHLDNTAKVGMFRIKSESSVASGVRRIEATTGRVSIDETRHGRNTLLKAAQFFKTAPNTILERMEQQANEMKQLRQALDKLKAEASLGEAKQFLASAKTVGGLHVITGTRQNLDANALRAMGDFMRDKDPSVVAVLASINGEKVSFLAVCGKEAVARGIKAGELVKSFLKETFALLTSQDSFFRKCRILVMQADNAVREETWLTDLDALDRYTARFTLVGGGGTDFRPAFARIAQLRQDGALRDLQGVLYFTDGKGIYPAKRPPFETAFLFLEDGTPPPDVPPWAMRLVLQPEEFAPDTDPKGR